MVDFFSKLNDPVTGEQARVRRQSYKQELEQARQEFIQTIELCEVRFSELSTQEGSAEPQVTGATAQLVPKRQRG